MHSQFYSLSSGPPSSLSPQQASQRKFIQKRDRTKRPQRGPGQRLQLRPARSEFPEGDAAIRESVLTLLPPRVLRRLLGLLVFLSFDTTVFFFFFCKREKQTHTHAHTHKRKRYKEFITNEAVPHTTLWLPAPAREPPLSPARARAHLVQATHQRRMLMSSFVDHPHWIPSSPLTLVSMVSWFGS